MRERIEPSLMPKSERVSWSAPRDESLEKFPARKVHRLTLVLVGVASFVGIGVVAALFWHDSGAVSNQPTFQRQSMNAQQDMPRLIRRNDLSYNICRAHQPLVENAIQFRMQGLPVSMAEETVENTIRTDPRLWRFLVSSIDLAYSNPQALSSNLRSGNWADACATYVRGY